jgi:haloalkane dehalogenase
MWPFAYLRKLPALTRTAPQFVERHVDVQGQTLTYWDEGNGPVMVLLHGNPTSRELWRHMVAPLAQHHRVLVPDLMNAHIEDSDPLTTEHTRVLAWLDALGVTGPVVWVAHDWGGAVVLDIHRTHPQRVAAVALCEALMMPVTWRDYDLVPWALGQLLQVPGLGAWLLVHLNLGLRLFVPLGSRRKTTAATRAMYAKHYPNAQARRQVLRWVQNVPTKPAHAYFSRINQARESLLSSQVPKLLLVGEPGFAINAASVKRMQAVATHLQVVHVGEGIHYFPEDEPDACAQAITSWVLSLP